MSWRRSSLTNSCLRSASVQNQRATLGSLHQPRIAMPTSLRSLLDNLSYLRGPLLLAIVALAASSAAAAPSTPSVPTSVFDGILRDRDPTPEVSTAELQAALAKPSAIVLDARPY